MLDIAKRTRNTRNLRLPYAIGEQMHQFQEDAMDDKPESQHIGDFIDDEGNRVIVIDMTNTLKLSGLIAGEKLREGAWVVIGDDGKVYNAIKSPHLGEDA